jgi:hypothetical protein
VAAHAAHGHRRVDRFALGLIRVALQAFGSVRVLIEGNRVRSGKSGRRCDEDHRKQSQHWTQGDRRQKLRIVS